MWSCFPNVDSFCHACNICPTQILCPGHIKRFWKSSETFVVSARAGNIATGGQHRRTQCCRHNVSPLSRGLKADLDGTILTVACNLLKSWLGCNCHRVLKHVSKSYNLFRVVCDSLGQVVRLIYTKQSMLYGWHEQVACDSRTVSQSCAVSRNSIYLR